MFYAALECFADRHTDIFSERDAIAAKNKNLTFFVTVRSLKPKLIIYPDCQLSTCEMLLA